MEGFSKSKLHRLQRSIQWSRKQLEHCRSRQLQLIEQYIGSSMGEGADRSAVNLMETAVTTYHRLLSPLNPQCLVTTDYPQLEAASANIATLMNHTAHHVGLGSVLEESVLNAIFSMGIVKVGHESTGTIPSGGRWWRKTGTMGTLPQLEAINVDDWVHDFSATAFERRAYSGQRIQMTNEEFQDSDLFPSKAKSLVKPRELRTQNEGGDPRVESLDVADDWNDDVEFEPLVEMWEIYLPYERRLIYLSADLDGPVLRSVPWTGLDCGPHLLLRFHRVPKRIIPIPPAGLWSDMHDLANILFNKLASQAKRQKTLVGVMPGGGDDMERISDSADGEGVKLVSPDKTREIRFGGVDQLNLAFFMAVKELFSYTAGNLDVLGGFGVEAQTVGQETLLSQAGTRRLDEMQQRVTQFAADIFRAIGYVHWNDPLISQTLARYEPGPRVTVTSRFSPASKQGNFWQYNFKLEPYSLHNRSPAQHLGILDAFTAKVMQAYPMIREAGGEYDWLEWAKRQGEYSGLPDLNRLLISGPRPEPGAVPTDDLTPGQPSVTTRNYVRSGRPGPTNQGHSRQMQQILAGAAAGRPEMGTLPARG